MNQVAIESEDRKKQDLSLSILNQITFNKSNILNGIVNQSNHKKSNKTPNKRGKFSSSYASNYISPYSTKFINENPKSYM